MENLIAKYIEEATDLIADLEKSLLSLENNPVDKDLISHIFRAMHTLKGSSAMFGFIKIGELTHNLENIYDLIRDDKVKLSKELLTVTLDSIDCVKLLIAKNEILSTEEQKKYTLILDRVLLIAASLNAKPLGKVQTPAEQSVSDNTIKTYYISFKPEDYILTNGTNPLYLLDDLFALGKCRIIARNSVPDIDSLNPINCYFAWHIFIATSKSEQEIKEVFLFVEEDCKLSIHRIFDEDILDQDSFIEQLGKIGNADIDIIALQEFINTTFSKKEEALVQSINAAVAVKENQISSIRVSSDKLDKLMNMVSELVTEQARLSLLAEQFHIPELISVAEKFEKLSRQIRANAFSICLIPFETLFTRFQRLVRDLAIGLNKDITLITEGGETEIDKTIIEGLTDPLLHILRNSIDHGVESTEARIAKGKPAQGKITLKAFYSGTFIHIQIKDDGQGIDAERIKQKAIEKGLIDSADALTDEEALGIIFLPGFSTASQVTEVSGRGVGMDVVKKKIAEMRGDIEISSKVNQGTTITLKLPLSLSIIDGLLIGVQQAQFVIPLSSLEKCYEVEQHQITSAFNNTIEIDGEQIPFLDLRNVFDLTTECPAIRQLIAIRYDNARVGIISDFIVGKYQAVLKPLGPLYKNIEMMSGATILGDGSIALVIDTSKIIKQFSNAVLK